MKRLRDFIQQSGYSLDQLEKKSSIPKVKLQNLIDESIEPNLDDLRKIANSLSLPISYLISANEKIDKVNIMFRNEIKTQSKLYEADKFSMLIGNTFSLLGNYERDKILKDNFAPVTNDFENARSLSIRFRELYFDKDQLSPIFNLPAILEEKMKCVIYVSEIGADGASAFINGVPFIFISPRFEGRMLFTLAHELGHILGHFDKNNDFVHYDEDIFKNGIGSDQVKESFANAFASNLLMPEKGIGIALKKVREHLHNSTDQIGDLEILLLARIYGVSFEGAAMRLENLKILPMGSSYSLSKEIKAKFGSPEKRAEEAGLPARTKVVFPKVSPTLVSNALKKISEGTLSIGKASEILSLSIREMLATNASAN